MSRTGVAAVCRTMHGGKSRRHWRVYLNYLAEVTLREPQGDWIIVAVFKAAQA